MNEIPSLHTVYDNNGIPILLKNPNLILYMDFCPSESLREDTPTPDSTFVCSACFIDPKTEIDQIKKISEIRGHDNPLKTEIDQIKKISEIRGHDRRIQYMGKIYDMMKEEKITWASLCILTTEQEYYKNALRHVADIHDLYKKTHHMNINEAMAYYDNIAMDMALKFNIKKNKLISIIGIFVSAYYVADYFLKMLKLHQMPNPLSVKIIIDRPPGGMGGSNIDVFNNVYESCFDKIHVKTTEHYRCPIEIGIIKDNVQEDFAGLKLADMMAHMSAATIVMKNSHNINTKINRSAQLPEYTEENREKIFLLMQSLRKEGYIMELILSDLIRLDNLEKSGFVLPNQYLKK